jgi:uncharacterized protein YqgV (UPF0045/DUF77 family)
MSERVSAQVSIYPLRQEDLAPAIARFGRVLAERGLDPQVGAMSTMVSGDLGMVFSGLQSAFAEACRAGPLVMTLTVSNACPVPDED